MTTDIEIVHAQPAHADAIAPVFDTYRCWYGMQSDPEGARYFISQRLIQNESEIFFARHQEEILGFTQLYPLFSSVSMDRIWLLNDLFIAETARRTGVGSLLLQTAAEFARSLGALRLQLETKHDNLAAQAAYEALGWQRDSEFFNYTLDLTDASKGPADE